MTKKEILLTSEGFLELEAELIKLKTEKRPQIIEAIKEARAQGDLSENADYDAARTQQADVESKISELEHILGNAKIIEKNKEKDKVNLGSTVVIEYQNDNETEEYHIVGSMEQIHLKIKSQMNHQLEKQFLIKSWRYLKRRITNWKLI